MSDWKGRGATKENETQLASASLVLLMRPRSEDNDADVAESNGVRKGRQSKRKGAAGDEEKNRDEKRLSEKAVKNAMFVSEKAVESQVCRP